MGDLTLILGPMKSGKSFEMISYFAPLKYTNIPFAVFTSTKNVRDKNVWSRNGVELEATKIDMLKELLNVDARIIGIDEIHMFEGQSVAPIEKLLKAGSEIVISGLSTGHQQDMFDIVAALLALGPKEVIFKRAVCETCKQPDAIYTQILDNQGNVVTLDQKIIPDTGEYIYRVICRTCL